MATSEAVTETFLISVQHWIVYSMFAQCTWWFPLVYLFLTSSSVIFTYARLLCAWQTLFLRKISLAKPKKHFEIEYAFYLPLPLKSTNETTSVLLSSPPIWKFKLRRKGTKLRQDDEKRDKESFCIQMFNTKKESTSFSMDSHNCWYFQSIMLFNMRKIVRFPLTLFLDHVVTFFMLLVHTLAGRHG